MNNEFALSLHYKVKEKFFAEPGTIVFISSTSENLDELVAQTFPESEFDEYFKLVEEHWKNSKPYFVISHLEQDRYVFFHVCKDFSRQEYFLSHQVLRFRLNPFKKVEIDIERVREDLAQLSELLSRDSKAS